MDPVLALVVIGALMCITVVAVVLARRGRELSFPASKLDKGTVPEAQAIQIRPPAPVLKNITFKQALESDALATGLEELAKRQVEYAFGFQSSNAVVQAVSLAEQNDELVIAYEFPRTGTALPEAGAAVIALHPDRGTFLPMLRDANGGRLAVFAKGDPLRPANAAALIQGIAHVVSGMNVLRHLKEVDRRLSVLAE